MQIYCYGIQKALSKFWSHSSQLHGVGEAVSRFIYIHRIVPCTEFVFPSTGSTEWYLYSWGPLFWCCPVGWDLESEFDGSVYSILTPAFSAGAEVTGTWFAPSPDPESTKNTVTYILVWEFLWRISIFHFTEPVCKVEGHAKVLQWYTLYW